MAINEEKSRLSAGFDKTLHIMLLTTDMLLE